MLITENDVLRYQLSACLDLEQQLEEQQLEERQSEIKELWKQNCDQVQEFDLIICERNKELGSLKKELEAKNMMVELRSCQD